MHWEAYHCVESIEEALQLLDEYAGASRVIAGGTDLVIQLKNHQRRVKALVSLSSIKALRYIEQDGETIRIGALSTHNELAKSDLLMEKAKALSLAARAVGSPQIRNIGTVGGNIVNAQPAADTAIALLALGAKAKIVSSTGERVEVLENLFKGIGESSVNPAKEIVTEFIFPAFFRSAFQRLALRKAFTLPIINVAVALLIDQKNICREARIAIGPVSTVPFRAKKAEAILNNEIISEKKLVLAAAEAMREINPRDSLLRGSAMYRRAMVKVLLERALRDAVVVK
ncbi:MAG: xanthine dehydrogenase family protein subunit M [Bacillota bacterium]